MEFDDVLYVVLLIPSMILGNYYRRIQDPVIKRWIGSAVGLASIVIVSGYNTLHILFFITINTLLFKFGSQKWCHIGGFLFSFGYLLLIRCWHLIGLPPPPSSTDRILMMIALRLVSLGFEVHDGVIFTSRWGTPVDKLRTLDVFHYALCYIGVLTGPYYSFQTYWDMLHAPFSRQAPCDRFALRRLRMVPVYMALYLLGSTYWPIELLQSKALLSADSLWLRIWYMVLLCVIFRLYFYSGFLLSESVCIMSGLGVYPTCLKSRPGMGPSDYSKWVLNQNEIGMEYDFQTVHNVNEWKVESVATIREAMRNWNMTVQYWLVKHVYKRIKTSKPIRIGAVMLVSSVWHGIGIGYYLSMMSTSLFVVVEQLWDGIMRGRIPRTFQQVWYSCWWVLRVRWLEYMCVAYLLLDATPILNFWRSVYFYGHFSVLLLLAIGYVVSRMKI